ncbi:GNAT family N-acetyltransferase [Desertivirga brevis]|uniref:GNAT family N-acetyltransferase n=1 Tax=Desertivirga brevis TaxID=2810310 RepID=UPI001A956CA4|nr:GNAT family N-acetyltransferase [Pedobacter sp. SYSU D00873]
MDFNLIIWGSKEYEEMVELRHQVLRKPLGLHYTEEYLSDEKKDILIGVFENGKLAGCCILRKVSGEVVQLKQMAVAPELQRTGIGSLVISFAEETAKNIGHGKIFMHARKEACGFYQKQGYHVRGEEFEEVGIPHLMMTKELN